MLIKSVLVAKDYQMCVWLSWFFFLFFLSFQEKQKLIAWLSDEMVVFCFSSLGAFYIVVTSA
jgi:hypothetical protein